MKKVLFLFLLLVGMTNVYGQKFAVKSNLLYDADCNGSTSVLKWN